MRRFLLLSLLLPLSIASPGRAAPLLVVDQVDHTFRGQVGILGQFKLSLNDASSLRAIEVRVSAPSEAELTVILLQPQNGEFVFPVKKVSGSDDHVFAIVFPTENGSAFTTSIGTLQCLMRTAGDAPQVTAVAVGPGGDRMSVPVRIRTLPARSGGQLSVAPNPTRGPVHVTYQVSHPGRVIMAVFDVTGRRVATIFEGEAIPGVYGKEWNGRDEKGIPVTAGLYFVKVLTGGDATSERIAVIR